MVKGVSSPDGNSNHRMDFISDPSLTSLPEYRGNEKKELIISVLFQIDT